ncbi:hypothetical protein Sbal223_4394 (plasmid) [Shewanella baltica OS223]|uniref:hypothetical protein n=1 Tax=Shewanella baltica TaxID=62322 RepID=UPI0001530C8C|nr:hypothetical protein [Shewanella baltica]ACK48854.1 hypothetical protein Sbal223_4394 [Shewanella baltica OS223]
MKCIECKFDNLTTGKFCSNCGQPLAILDGSTSTKIPPTYVGYLNARGELCDSSGHNPLIPFSSISNLNGAIVEKNTDVLFEVVDGCAVGLRSIPSFTTAKLNFDSFEVKGGDYPTGEYSIIGEYASLMSANSPRKFIFIAGAKVEKITEERALDKLKSVMYGSVAAIATLGVGVAVGLMHAAKKYYLLEITLPNGKFLIVQCRPAGYEKIILTAKKKSLIDGDIDEVFDIENAIEPQKFKNLNTSKCDEIITPKIKETIGYTIILIFILIYFFW